MLKKLFSPKIIIYLIIIIFFTFAYFSLSIIEKKIKEKNKTFITKSYNNEFKINQYLNSLELKQYKINNDTLKLKFKLKEEEKKILNFYRENLGINFSETHKKTIILTKQNNEIKRLLILKNVNLKDKIENYFYKNRKQ